MAIGTLQAAAEETCAYLLRRQAQAASIKQSSQQVLDILFVNLLPRDDISTKALLAHSIKAFPNITYPFARAFERHLVRIFVLLFLIKWVLLLLVLLGRGVLRHRYRLYVTASRGMLHFIQVLDHASVIEPICPETSEQESEEVKKSESTHQLCQKVQDVEAADVDRLLEWVLPEIHRNRKVGIKAIQGWSVIILDVTYFIACSDARRFSLISE